jgi:hypothetical protein
MTEDEFDRLIDCRFPYRDAREAKRLIALGRSISANAHFRTLSEICRPPARADVTAVEQFALMRDWADGFEHPLKDVALVCATAAIERRDLSVDHVLRIMDQIAAHRDAYAALSIAYFACDDMEDRAEARANEICNHWRRGSGRG